MPFSWYHPPVPPARPHEAEKMYLAELRERAALLMRLGFPREKVMSRLRANIRWDFELHSAPSHLQRVEQVVNAVFRARGLGAGGPPSVDP